MHSACFGGTPLRFFFGYHPLIFFFILTSCIWFQRLSYLPLQLYIAALLEIFVQSSSTALEMRPIYILPNSSTSSLPVSSSRDLGHVTGVFAIVACAVYKYLSIYERCTCPLANFKFTDVFRFTLLDSKLPIIPASHVTSHRGEVDPLTPHLKAGATLLPSSDQFPQLLR